MPETLPDLSVVIVSFNVRDLLRPCLKSVRRPESQQIRIPAGDESVTRRRSGHGSAWSLKIGSTESAEPGFAERSRHCSLNIEVIVVDNASQDGSAEMVREAFPEVHLIVNKTNAGFAAANNQGIRAGRGRHVLLLNPDTEILGDALARLVGFLDHHPDYAVAGAGLVYPDGSFQHSAFRFPGAMQTFFDFFPINHRLTSSRLNGRYPRAWYERSQPFDIDHPLGACLAVRREAIDQVGLLDENFFMYCEEIDWCWRMRKAGWKIACVPAARVVHHAGASTRQFRDEMFVALWRSRFRLFEKHLGPRQRRLIGWIVRLGVLRERLRATDQASSGRIPMGELASRLAAYERVARIAAKHQREATFELGKNHVSQNISRGLNQKRGR